MSSYDAPFDVVERFLHRSVLSATNNSKKVIEKLFCNKKINYSLFQEAI
jgi:hypothetical protein